MPNTLQYGQTHLYNSSTSNSDQMHPEIKWILKRGLHIPDKIIVI